MPNERDGRQRMAQALAPKFPSDDGLFPDLPSRADASHVARRRLPSEPAHEVDVDEVEFVDEPPYSERRPLPPIPTPPAFRRSLPPPALPESFAPSAPFQVPIATSSQAILGAGDTVRIVRKRSHTVTAVASAVIALAIGAAAGITFRPRASLPPTHTSSATLLRASEPPAAAPVTASKSDVPTVDVAKLPRTTLGTVVGSPGHRLWVDGNLAADWQTPVSCGSHVVQVGSAGTPRTVDVPCGTSISVSP